MTLELFANLLQANPFAPYSMHLADGRELKVTNPELVMIAGDSRSVSLFEPQRATEFIDLSLIVSVRVEDPQS